MSYPSIDEKDFLEKILNRKEFFSLKADPERNFRDPPEAKRDPLLGKFLKVHSHQLFVRNFMNPNTPYKRLHLMHATGTGKTIGAVSIAQEFINVYKKLYASSAAKMQAGRRNYTELDRSTPTVFVLGFGGTKGAFIRELLKYPEFGFITLSEKDEFIKRQKIADAGLPDDIKHLKEFYTFLKKRITNKSKDGFYKFFGYDEFVNRLFLSDEVKLTDLEAQVIQKLRAGENVTLEEVIYENINSGKIQVNQQLIAMFENSLLICDEIHNTYNMNMKNNRGVAIQFLLDSVPSLRFLSLSATPINNSPTEVVELINYLVPTDKKITKKDFFSNPRTLIPGKLNEIGELTKGRISFLQDVNIKYFPKRVFLGEPLLLPKQVENFPEGSSIPYLKFIQCPMSDFHQATYNHHLETAWSGVEKGSLLEEAMGFETKEQSKETEQVEIEQPEETDELAVGATKYVYHSIPTDGYSIYDIVFPNPDTKEYGLFKSSEVRNKISLAPQEWRDENKIMMKKYSAINSLLTGDFLLQDNIGKYSTKCKELLNTLFKIINSSNGDPSKCQKIMIYHDRVKMSGVLLLQELLRTNNILDEHSEPVDTTICCICGKNLAEHIDKKAEHTHNFRPVRFVIAHSDIDKVTMDQSLSKFNSADNAHGMNYMILIGSKIIKESYDFKDIQNLIIMSLPINIPTLIQVFGRCIRKNSHINLPPEQRQVFIRILISTVNTSFKYDDPISPEMYRYIDKLSDYIVIQNIEREFNRNAIDADIHRDIIMPPGLKSEYFPNGPGSEPVNAIGNLYFEPNTTVPNYTLDDINLSTFTAYKYYEEEIKTISFIIKRLFMTQPVWTYNDLWTRVKSPPIGVEMNPKLFNENNFIIALNNLINSATTIIAANKQKQELTETFLIERIFDYNERYIYMNGERHKIEQVGEYYILFPVAGIPSNPLNVVYAEYIEHVRDKERAMIKELVEPNDRILVDVETYLRPMVKQAGVRINIDNFVKESKANVNYVAKKNVFTSIYKHRDDITGFLSDFSAQFQMSFTEEAIIYSMLGPKAIVADSSTYQLYEKVLDLLDKFGVIVYMKEIRKYKDTIKQYKSGLPELPDDTAMGYMTSKSIRLFDPQTMHVKNKVSPEMVERGKWIEISKISLNRHMNYKENEIIVGYLESAEDYMKFKLRKPVQKIKEEIQKEAHARKISKSELEGITARTAIGDTRLIERGIVCATKNKHELLQIIANLGISVSKLDKSDIRIKKLCEIIKRRLMESEMKERQKDSRYKYLYGWWDSEVSLTSLV
ncbi:Helicase D6/D11 putative [Pacmanvirus A23]|uniref:Helicase D6/D11 putative n=1 Tax=Pacmanvirus A23 TaxID=1932881 RepID=UPI000A095EB3|nr:Helicase D6/D11 putative [Pacmanvirus A23]SIP86034.1 Helicase D6/D11 putative [Pacmanvirus A23]